MIDLTTAGESHGKGLFAILEGIPAGLKLDLGAIDARLALRQSGYGRGDRQRIEADKVEILSGVRDLVTLGSPIALAVWNRDYENWKDVMAPEGCDVTKKRLTKVRPGHADLAGMQKFRQDDARNILERASARETAVRVAAGEICRALLFALKIEIRGYVKSVGPVSDEKEYNFDEIYGRSPILGMIDGSLEREACRLVDRCKAEGETLGGIVELRVRGLKSGFGSCMTYAEKLDARLCSALMSVQAIKGAEIGLGFAASRLFGGSVHDEIFADGARCFRATNHAGGVEGGMSNGEDLILRAAMKPVPTLMKGLRTVDTDTMEDTAAAPERSDVCAIFACETVCEAAVATELAKAVCERLGGDTMDELIKRNGELK